MVSCTLLHFINMVIRHIYLVFLLFILGFLNGCGSKEINPLEDDRGIFSFYGALV